jgi:ABC-2 type transport system ATP-binding protein
LVIRLLCLSTPSRTRIDSLVRGSFFILRGGFSTDFTCHYSNVDFLPVEISFSRKVDYALTPKIHISDLSVQRSNSLVIDQFHYKHTGAGWLGVIGSNGAGKTTLLRALSGRLSVKLGSITLNDSPQPASRETLAKSIGFAPDITTLPDVLFVQDIIELARFAPGEMPTTGGIKLLWEGLQMDSLMHKRVGQLSSGMRQRVALMTAFMNGQAIVVLDEPFNWLDPLAAYETKSALQQIVMEGTLLITALHDLTTLLTCCSAGMILHDGKIILQLGKDEMPRTFDETRRIEQRIANSLRLGKPAD